MVYQWRFRLFISHTALCFLSGWTEPDWNWDAKIPEGGRENIYQHSEDVLPAVLRQGRLHALHYPVTTTGVTLPYEPTRNFLEETDGNPLRQLLKSLFQGFASLRSFDDAQKWLGLNSYPEEESESIPFKENSRPENRMGLTLVEYENGATGFTISCAQCHSGNLFGKRVLGMTNRFTRANEAFVKGKKATSWVSGGAFQWATGATDAEKQLFLDAKHNLKFVEGKVPVQRGLDTSLAQVSLSLSRRAQDPWASKESRWARHPRYDRLRHEVADSKPAVWWNVKYKTRWLSDGSVLSGNPILTNFLWNEIGRGSDLKELQQWIEDNEGILRELTAAVFATEAPSYFDFFDENTFDITSAKRGQTHFNQLCSRCHGHYIKGWEVSEGLPILQQLQTVKVEYPQPTVVEDVGTDPNRYLGMTSLEQLNKLQISKDNGIRVLTQKGYVPPPLVGIWARWPYMHNNSMPTLCDVLTPEAERPRGFYMGEALDSERDFDSVCNGYPRSAPAHWKSKENYFSTAKPGSSNQGHDQGLFIKNGKNLIDGRVRTDLVRFLQTL